MQTSKDIKKAIDFSTPINFLKPRFDFVENVNFHSNYDSLYKKIASYYKANINEIELFTGEQSAIFTLFKFLNLPDCIIYSPSSLMYKKACVNFAYTIRLINRFENIYLPVKKNSLIIFSNPSIPDGKYYNLDTLFSYWTSMNCTILLDERFLDFFNKDSSSKYINKYTNIYILRTAKSFFSKVGINIATIISNRKNIEKMKYFEPLDKISKWDTFYFQKALEDKWFPIISKGVYTKNKIELENILEKIDFVESVYKSNSNFILVKLKNIKAKAFQKKLLEYNILIKDCSTFDFLDDNFIGVCVKSSKMNKILKEALEKIC